MTEGILYFGNFEDTGVGYAARGYLQVLRELGYDCDVVRAVTAYGQFNPIPNLADYFVNPAHGDARFTTQIVHANPVEAHRYISCDDDIKRKVLVTFWETDRLPQSSIQYPLVFGGFKTLNVIDSLKQFDEIWVPSNFVKSVFDDAGLTARVVPHVIPSEFLLDIEDTKKKAVSHEGCRFYTVGTWDRRKNPAKLLQAYIDTGWTHEDKVNFYMHLLPANRTREALNEHAKLVSDSFLRASDGIELPPVTTNTIPLPVERLVGMHRGGDVFVTASRGEAACYDAIIAAAYGNVVIGGGGPALQDLQGVSPDNVRLLEQVVTPVVTDSTYPWFDIDQNWFDYRTDDLRDSLVSAKESLKVLKLEGSAPATKYYTAKNIAKSLPDWNIK